MAEKVKITLGGQEIIGSGSFQIRTKLSTGDDPTLGNYRVLAAALFGEDSKAVAFLDKKIKEQGADQEVIINEAQTIYLLGHIHREEE